MPRAAKGKKPAGKKPSEVLAESVVALRKRKGWSQARLAEELAILGVGIDQTAVARIEAKRNPGTPASKTRDVSLDETYGIAAALGVKPTVLLLFNDPVVIGDNLTVPARRARMWVRGHGPLRPSDADTYYSEVSDEEKAAATGLLLRKAEHDLQKVNHALADVLDELHAATTSAPSKKPTTRKG